MIFQKVYEFVLIIVTIITTIVFGPTPVNSATKDIFQPPSKSNISQISGTSTPWVIPELIPTIDEFKKNVFEDLKNSTAVQKIWDMKSDSSDTRTIFFKILNKFLDDLGHPAPAALSNIVSKSSSLFDPLNVTVLFETDAINFAEFFLSRNVEVTRDTATRYVDSLSKALDLADVNDKESVFQATLDGYANFIASYGFKLVDVIDELFQLFSSEIIVMYDK